MDLTRWLQNDLGLRNMTESDLNGLMYHPRHGSLCRRFVKFLADSTLSNKKYPNIYAREEYEEAKSELAKRNQVLHQTMMDLERQMQACGNTEMELKFLKDKHQYLLGLEDLLRTTTEALEEIANRPSMSFEQVQRNIEQAKYLDNTDLEKIYSFDEMQKFLSSTQRVPSSHELNSINDEYNRLTQTVEIMGRAVGMLLAKFSDKISNFKEGIVLSQPNVESLEALKMPDCEEIVLEANPEELALKEKRVNLTRSLELVGREVRELSDRYKSEKLNMNVNYKQALQEDINFLQKLSKIEEAIYGQE